MVLLADKSILHGSYLKMRRFRCRKLPSRQSKHMGSCAGKSFAMTFYSPDEGRSRTSHRSVRREISSNLKAVGVGETYNNMVLRVKKVLAESIVQR